MFNPRFTDIHTANKSNYFKSAERRADGVFLTKVISIINKALY